MFALSRQRSAPRPNSVRQHAFDAILDAGFHHQRFGTFTPTVQWFSMRWLTPLTSAGSLFYKVLKCLLGSSVLGRLLAVSQLFPSNTTFARASHIRKDRRSFRSQNTKYSCRVLRGITIGFIPHQSNINFCDYISFVRDHFNEH